MCRLPSSFNWQKAPPVRRESTDAVAAGLSKIGSPEFPGIGEQAYPASNQPLNIWRHAVPRRVGNLVVHVFGIVALITLVGAVGGLTRVYLEERRSKRRS